MDNQLVMSSCNLEEPGVLLWVGPRALVILPLSVWVLSKSPTVKKHALRSTGESNLTFFHLLFSQILHSSLLYLCLSRYFVNENISGSKQSPWHGQPTAVDKVASEACMLFKWYSLKTKYSPQSQSIARWVTLVFVVCISTIITRVERRNRAARLGPGKTDANEAKGANVLRCQPLCVVRLLSALNPLNKKLAEAQTASTLAVVRRGAQLDLK